MICRLTTGWLSAAFLVLSLLGVSQVSASMNAQMLYGQTQQLVYQIRVIDVGSGDKSSIGSGFLISDEGYIATNFHVVSSFVHDPDKFRLEYVDHQNNIAESRLIAIDVIHDLAILKADIESSRFMALNDNPLTQGERLFSMGNPHDLGMTIIEGTNNGLVKKARHKRILFSGSLNPGMSGGPAMNRFGEVIGINVSKAGEQLSFLVPVVYLKQLLEDVLSGNLAADFSLAIRSALYNDQETFYSGLLKRKFSQEPFGDLLVPGKVSDILNCWGHTLNNNDIRYDSFHQHCRLDDDIFIRDDFSTGNLYYNYEWMEAGELNPLQFYNALQFRFQQGELDNVGKKDYVSNFACHTDFVELAEKSWKVATCMRQYNEYQGLFDATLIMALVDEYDRAAVISVGAAGISLNNAQALFEKFMRGVQWSSK